MFPSNVKKYAFLGGVSKVKFNGTVYEPDENGLITIDTVYYVDMLTVSESTYVTEKTWKQIKTAVDGGKTILFRFPDGWATDCGETEMTLKSIGSYDAGQVTVYCVEISVGTFETNDEDGTLVLDLS